MGDALRRAPFIARSALIGLLVLGATGCMTTSRWQSGSEPDVLDAAALLADDTLGLRRDQRANEVPRVPVRKRLRPCCAFGSALRVRLGPVGVPGFEIGNIRSPDDLGRHTYDAGQSGADQVMGSEKNGLVYTCRGGFIDIAHVRDYVDWTLYLATEIGRRLESGGTIELPESEGGKRRFRLEPIDPDLISVLGRRELTASLAIWAGFQLSLWHEIATWYGWSSSGLFSERASAFSPEDLYSNLLGAKLAGAIISGGNARSESLFNEAVDRWLEQSLSFLEAVPAEQGERVMAAIDGDWWDSSARLPDAHLVRKRSLQSGNRIEPWLVAEASTRRIEDGGNPICSASVEPHALRNPSKIPGLAFDDALLFEIELDPKLRRHADFDAFGESISHRDFPELLDLLRAAVRREFGPDSDRPDAGR